MPRNKTEYREKVRIVQYKTSETQYRRFLEVGKQVPGDIQRLPWLNRGYFSYKCIKCSKRDRE